MKTKKYLWSLLAVLLMAAVSINFTSCGDDDDDDNGGEEETASIVGDWYIAGADYPVYQFKSDGTCTSNYYEDSEGNNVATYSDGAIRMRDNGEYQLEGNTLTIHWLTYQSWNESSNSWGTAEENNEYQHYTISLSNNTLRFISLKEYSGFKGFTLTRK